MIPQPGNFSSWVPKSSFVLDQIKFSFCIVTEQRLIEFNDFVHGSECN